MYKSGTQSCPSWFWVQPHYLLGANKISIFLILPSCLLHSLSSWQVWSTGCSLYSCPVITHRMEALPLSEVLLILGTQISYSWLTYQRPILREVKIEKSYMIAVFPGMNVILREKYQCQSPNKFLPRGERRPGSREFRSSSQSNRLHCNRVAECLPSMHRTWVQYQHLKKGAGAITMLIHSLQVRVAS